jgi:coenzyme F420-reducing hydrogenase gamma subunit
MAVERMAGIEITENAKAARTLLLELERLYNHIGDIGNMCAGTGVANVIPVDCYIPGCPPTPVQIIMGLHSLIDKMVRANTK